MEKEAHLSPRGIVAIIPTRASNHTELRYTLLRRRLCNIVPCPLGLFQNRAGAESLNSTRTYNPSLTTASLLGTLTVYPTVLRRLVP